MVKYPAKFILTITLICLFIVACGSPQADDSPSTQPPATEVSSPPTDTPPAATESEELVAEATIAPTETAVLATPTPVTFPTIQPVTHTSFVAGAETEEEIILSPLSLHDYLQPDPLAEEAISGEQIKLALRAILGEVELPHFDDMPNVPLYIGQDFIEAAYEFVEADEADPELQAEVAQLLAIVFPTLEQVRANTIPHDNDESQLNRGAGVAAMSQQTAVACDRAWADGLSDSAGTTDCFQFEAAFANDHMYEVYYPAEWEGESEREALYRATIEAMLESVAVFSDYGLMGDAVAIFSPLRLTENNGFMSTLWQFDLEEPCPIYIYTVASEHSLPQFKQAVAHEMFHCFQAWNYQDAVKHYETNKWWVEGSAEYFSNVVYPDALLEHRLVDHFTAHSLTKSIFEMGHVNGVVFQHLANELGGPEQVLQLIDNMSLTSRAEQETYMRDFPDMVNMLYRLVLAHLTVGIPDHGGTPLWIDRPGVTIFTPEIGQEGTYQIGADPFVLNRHLVRYEPEKRYDQQGDLPGNGRYGVATREDRRNPAAWNVLPEVILGNCEEDKGYVFIVTTVDDATPHFEIQVEEVEAADCDACVLRTWRLVPESFTAFMNRILQEQGAPEGMPAGMSFEIEIAGDNLIQFLENRQLITQRDGFQIIARMSGGPSVTSTIDGLGSGSYTADGEFLTITNLIDVAERVQVTMDGQPVSATMGPDSGTVSLFGHTAETPGFGGPEGPMSETIAYTCEGNLLTMYMPDEVVLDFERVERILPMPDVEPEVTPAP